jgi:hypothetical protein
VQDDVTHRIVDALKITLSPAEKERLADTETSKTSNVVAYDCVLRGREFMLGKEKNLETFGQAIKYFKQALEHDPNYSVASLRARFQPIPAIGFVLPGDNLYATSSSLTYLVSAFFVA